jgi:hypothetical protein
MRRALTTVATAAAVVALASCGTRWVSITQATATDPSATTLNVSVDACLSLPTPQVTETDAEIRIRIDARIDESKSQKACGSGAVVTLSRAIGARSVVDEHSHNRLTVTFVPPYVTPPPIVGSVAAARGHVGTATITGFVVVDADGHGHMCDELKSDSVCRSPSIGVDWAIGNATQPALVTRGDTRVSATPLTLSGSLKDDVLYVGLS